MSRDSQEEEAPPASPAVQRLNGQFPPEPFDGLVEIIEGGVDGSRGGEVDARVAHDVENVPRAAGLQKAEVGFAFGGVP